MAIELLCKGCGQKLRVPDEHAGKQARCPSCQAITSVPAGAAGLGTASTDMPGMEMPSTEMPSTEMKVPMSPPARWSMKTPDGATYGPIDKSELDRWAAEGRLNAQCQVKNESDQQWRSAGLVYPLLDDHQSQLPSGQPFSPQSGNPFADQPQNPYASPATPGGFTPTQRYLEPHRGAVILTLGIISIIPCCCIFIIPGICAWTMGNNDLNRIRMGRMDLEGKGLTMAGMILGIIGTIINALLGVVQLMSIAV